MGVEHLQPSKYTFAAPIMVNPNLQARMKDTTHPYYDYVDKPKRKR